MKDCLERTTRFVFDASPAQAETYKSLGDVKILPVESSGFSVIIDIVEFALLPFDIENCYKSLSNAREKEDDFGMSMESFFAKTIGDFEPRFRTVAVSLNSTTFESSSNVAIEEVKKAASSIECIQKQGFGVVQIIAPSLGSDNIDPIYNQFNGEVSSYLSNRRNIDRLLLDNYPPVLANPLVNAVCTETLSKINKRNCYIPPRHVKFACALADGTTGPNFRLAEADGKGNLAAHSLVKRNGTRHLGVREVTLTLTGQQVCIPSTTNYNLCNESSVAPLVNVDTTKYAAGTAEVRDTGSKYSVNIPIRLHVDFTTKKSDSGFVRLAHL
jgi:hypothetical protein